MRLTLSLILLFLLVVPAFAGEVGKVTYAEGRVDVFSPGSQEAFYAEEGTPIHVGDSVRVKSNSRAEVTFKDKTLIRIAQNSKLDVVDYQLDADNNRKTATVKLERGKARTIISKMKDAAEFKIDTPNAAGTVKGSDVLTYFQGGNSGMLVIEGELSVFNPAYADTVLSIPAGSAVVVPMKGLPKGPREYLEIEKKLHNEDTSVPDHISLRKGASIIKGTIAKFAGDVKVTAKGASSSHAVKAGEVVSEGSKVVTGADGVVEISFDNGNALYLKPNTTIVILRLILDSKTGEYENVFHSDQGKIMARIEKLIGKSKFEIKTPTVVCGARGTIMYLSIAPGGVTTAFYEGGNGYMTNLISGQTMEVGAGGGASTDSTGSISEASSDAGAGGGSGGMDEGWDPSAGTSDHTSTESTSDNFMYDSDTSIDGAAEGSGSAGTGDAAGSPATGDEGAAGDNGLDSGQANVPITVADTDVLTSSQTDRTFSGHLGYVYMGSSAAFASDLSSSIAGVFTSGSFGAPTWQDTSISASVSGTYANPNSRSLWMADVQNVMPDGGRYKGWAIGYVNAADGVSFVEMVALSIDPSDNGGTLHGSFSGTSCAGTFASDGSNYFSIDPEEAVTVAHQNLFTASFDEGVVQYGSGYGHFDPAASPTDIICTNNTIGGKTLNLTGYDEWGIWEMQLMGTYTYSGTPSGSWRLASSGRQDIVTTANTYGYWLGTAIGTVWVDGQYLTGFFKGVWFSENQDTGVITAGDILPAKIIGSNDGVGSGNWQALSVGEWVHQTDSFTEANLGFNIYDPVDATNSLDQFIGVPITEAHYASVYGSGSGISSASADISFYSSTAGTGNTLWASTISGAYTGVPASLSLTGGDYTMDLTFDSWTNNQWHASVSGDGPAVPVVGDVDSFSGEAGGVYSSSGLFEGVAAGKWQSA